MQALPNVETPRFFARAEEALIHKWDGMTPAEARALQVDGVTGATYSSQSVIANMHAALDYAAKVKHAQKDFLTRQGIETLYD